MPTRRAAAARWLFAAAITGLFLAVTPAFAQLPDATIQRIADLQVQAAEVRSLGNSFQIDNATYNQRRNAIDAQLTPLLREVARLTYDDQKKVNAQIDGITKARLAILVPQWQKQADDFRTQKDQHQQDISAAIPADARAALEPQRRRILLQQKKDKGEISAEEFAAEDKKAQDEVMSLRNKYVAEGQRYADRFDNQLRLLTEAVANNPTANLPASRVPVRGGGTTDADYQKDVALGADITKKKTANDTAFFAQKLDNATHRETAKVLEGDYVRLVEKWRAAGRGDKFEQDVREYGRPAAGSGGGAAVGGFHEPASNPWIGGLIFFLVVAAVVVTVMTRRKPEGPPPVSDTYGTAQFAPPISTVEDEDCVRDGLFLGKSSAPERRGGPLNLPGVPVCSTPESHTLIVAASGTGKGTRVIIPTLLRYAGSALVIDPKGENAAITARSRRQHLGQKIHVLNPWNELGPTFEKAGFASATYNPLDLLDRNDPNVVAIAQGFAKAICPPLANKQDQFWQGSAASLLTAVFLWLADQPNETKTLARAREISSMSRDEFTKNYLVRMAVSKAFGGAIRENSAQFVGMPDPTYGGITTALNQNMEFMSDPQIKAATATSSFSMTELVTGRSTVYLVVPTDRADTQKTWLRLVLAAGMHTFKRAPSEQRQGRRCLFLIDEFGSLGRLDNIPSDIAMMRGFGLDLALIVQGLDQLKDHYQDAKGTILSNCAYKWFCNITDLDSAKWLSEALGKTTVRTTSTSSSSSSQGESQTESHGETARSLLNPDEIMHLGKGVAIALNPEGHPYYLQPIDYWNLQEAFGHLKEQHPGLFWQPPLEFDPTPYPPGAKKKKKADGNGKGHGDGSGQQGKRRSEEKAWTGGRMTPDQAREILGVRPNATRDEILQAYRDLMIKIHPDHGGSKYFAQQLNAAKAVLLGE
jgi:type IV secretion system protein VirD4